MMMTNQQLRIFFEWMMGIFTEVFKDLEEGATKLIAAYTPVIEAYLDFPRMVIAGVMTVPFLLQLAAIFLLTGERRLGLGCLLAWYLLGR
jgi:hypothetical protein